MYYVYVRIIMTQTYCRYDALKDRMVKETEKFMLQCYENTLQMVHGLLMMEKAYVNIKHPNFIGSRCVKRCLVKYYDVQYIPGDIAYGAAE